MENSAADISLTQPLPYYPQDSLAFNESVQRFSFWINDRFLKTHVVTHEPHTIGRDPSCPIFLDDKSLSRKHASVLLNSDNLCILTDLGSLNGTKRNELLLTPNVGYELRPGDRIRLGNVMGIFETVHCGAEEDQLTQLTQNICEEKPRRSLADLSNRSGFDERLAGGPLMVFSSPANDASSNTSSNLLADIVVDTEEVDPDLMPNPSQYVSRSPSPTYDSIGTELHTSSGRSRLSVEQSLLTNLLVHGTQEYDEKSMDTAAIKPDCALHAIAETEPFDSLDGPKLTSAPVLRTPCSSVQPISTSLVTPRLSGRSRFDLIAVNTPLLPTTTAAISSTPCGPRADAVTTTPLAFDSEPGLSSKHDSLGSGGYGMEFPETQPDRFEANRTSMLLVEESECAPFATSHSHSSPVVELLLQDTSSPSNGNSHHKQSSSVTQAAVLSTSAVFPYNSDTALTNEHHSTRVASPTVNGSVAFTESAASIATFNDIITPLIRRSVKLRRSVDLDDSQSSLGKKKVSTSSDSVASIDLPLSTDPSNDHPGETKHQQSVMDSELTQPMVQIATGILNSAAHCSNPTDVVHNAIQTPDHLSGLLTSKSVASSHSPVVDNLRCTNSPSSYPRNNCKEDPKSHSDEFVPIISEVVEDWESTQPMIQLRRNSFRAVRHSVDTTEIVSATEGAHVNFQPAAASRSPTVDDLSHKSDLVTPPNVLANVDNLQRISKSTSKRIIREPHVSSLFLSDAIGTVQFRSARKRNTRYTAALAEAEESPLDTLEILQLPGNSASIVRRASHCFGGGNTEEREQKNGQHRTVSIRKSRVSRVLRIPSPVQLPDSILSEDPSQLDGSPDRSVHKELTVSLEHAPLNSSQGASKKVMTDEPSNTKSNGSLLNDSRPSGSRSAIALAGFEESPEGPGEKPPGTLLTRPPLVCSLSVPLVDFSSFSDFVEERDNLHSESSIRKNIRSSLPGLSKKRIMNKPKVSRMSIQITNEHSASEVSSPRRSGRTVSTRNSTSATLPSLRRSRRSIANPQSYVPELSDSSVGPPSPKSRRISNRGKRVTVSKQSFKRETKRQTTHRLLRISSSSSLSEASSSLNATSPENSRVLLERYPSHTLRSKNTSMRLLFSGIDSAPFAKVLARIDAVETDDYLLASHLITSNEWKRTLKMLHARARGIPVVSVDWLVACKRIRKAPYPDPMQFLINPSAFDASRRRSIRGDRRSSHTNTDSNDFLHGWSFRSTPTVLPPPSDLARLTNLAGGHWMTDQELTEAVSNSTPRVVIIVAEDEFKAIHSRQPTRSLKLARALAAAIKSLPCVPVDWFLNSLMCRMTPSWPVEI